MSVMVRKRKNTCHIYYPQYLFPCPVGLNIYRFQKRLESSFGLLEKNKQQCKNTRMGNRLEFYKKHKDTDNRRRKLG